MTAGCLFQTVWNVVTGRPATSGIEDYDIFYFDDTDLSWEAEDAVIKAGREVFAGLPAEVEAPHGLSDVFNLVVRPDPVLAPQKVYEAKAARWKDEWPELTVLPWPS